MDSSRLVLSVRNVPGGVVFPGDPDAIRRLLVNLVNNAIRHTNSGQIDIDARRYNVEGQQWVQIRVRDSGSGMSDDVIARLGTAFATNKGVAGSSLSGGTGLGLAICKGIAGAHGGQITVSSEPNCGSVFTVNLRADLTEPVPIPADLKILREAAA